MKVCISAGHKVSMDGTLHCEGAVLDLANDEADELIAAGVVTKVKAPAKKKAAAKKKAEAKS